MYLKPKASCFIQHMEQVVSSLQLFKNILRLLTVQSSLFRLINTNLLSHLSL